MSPRQYGNVCGRRHPSRRGAIPQENLIIGAQPDHQSSRPSRPSPGGYLFDYWGEARLQQHQLNKTPEQGRLADLLPLSERPQACLRCRRDASNDELVGIHVGQLFNKSNRLPILHRSKFSVTPTTPRNRGVHRFSAKTSNDSFCNRSRPSVAPFE